MIVLLGLHFFKENDFYVFSLLLTKVQYFTLVVLNCFGWWAPRMRKQQLFPFSEKETPSVGKIEKLLSQYNCYRSAICHNLVLLSFLLFGAIYRRNKGGRLEVRVSVENTYIVLPYIKNI